MIQIILVDDEPLALEYLKSLIEKREDYRVIGAYTDALQAMKESVNLKPDIIITDICMDGIDGLEMAEQMREVWGREFIFIIVSGYGKFQYAKRALELGIRDYLLKPVTKKELFESLDNIKEEIEGKKYRDEILEEVAQTQKPPSVKMTGDLERLAEEILGFHVENVDVLLGKLLADDMRENEQTGIWEDLLMLLFRLLDERLGHRNGELQVFWQRTREESGLNKESVGKCVHRSILKIMEEKGAGSEYPVEYMRLFIRENYRQDISVQEFAEKFYMNKAYLGQKFKKATGVSVNDYLQRIRIEEAVRLADRTELSWQEIAVRVGYVNYITFLKYFVKQRGSLPSDYRK